MAEWPDDSSTDSARSLGQHTGSADKSDTETIRAGISETRERLSDTLNELGERLNPQVVKEQVTERVKEGIRDATIGRIEHMARSAADTVNSTRSGITDTIRDNPVPAAMVAIGLGWLLFNGRRSDSSADRWSASRDYARDSGSDRLSGSYSRSSSLSGSFGYDKDSDDSLQQENGVSRKLGDVKDLVADKAESVADSVKERAGQLADRGRDLADRAGNRASSMASSVSSRAHDVAGSVKQRTSQGARRVEDSFYDNPLAIGAISMAIGVVAGLAAPVTDREVQLMGDASERVADRVKEVAHEAKDKAQQVAGRVVDETKRVVKEETKKAENVLGTELGTSSYSEPGLGLS